FGGKPLADALGDYQETYFTLQDVSKELQSLVTQAQERALEAENLQRSLEEIDNANIEDCEDEELQEQIKRLESTEDFRSAAQRSTVALPGDDNYLNAPSAESLVEIARQAISEAPGDLAELTEIRQRLGSEAIELGDITAEISQFAASLTEEGPYALNQAQSRLAEDRKSTRLNSSHVSI